MIKINAIGDVCPIPVIKVKDAIKELNGKGVIEITVDNEIAVQNLSKIAQLKNIQILAEKKSQKEYVVTLTISEDDNTDLECKPMYDNVTGPTVVVFSSNKMGEGDDTLGGILIKSYIFALTKSENFPNQIICYNGGAFLTAENSEVLEDLKYLESQGVDICTCGTCINHYGLNKTPAVGTVSNMYEISEKLIGAGKIIKP